MRVANCLLLSGLLLCPAGPALSSQDIPEINSREAYEMIAQNPAFRLVDVRSIAEYYFVGHPEMAANVPLTFWDEKAQTLVRNERFIDDLKARYKPQDTLVFICRSGGRSRQAAQMAREAGYSSVYSVKEGFEGEKDAQGYRTAGGWKNSGLPYTYELKKDLLYRWP